MPAQAGPPLSPPEAAGLTSPRPRRPAARPRAPARCPAGGPEGSEPVRGSLWGTSTGRGEAAVPSARLPLGRGAAAQPRGSRAPRASPRLPGAGGQLLITAARSAPPRTTAPAGHDCGACAVRPGTPSASGGSACPSVRRCQGARSSGEGRRRGQSGPRAPTPASRGPSAAVSSGSATPPWEPGRERPRDVPEQHASRGTRAPGEGPRLLQRGPHSRDGRCAPALGQRPPRSREPRSGGEAHRRRARGRARRGARPPPPRPRPPRKRGASGTRARGGRATSSAPGPEVRAPLSAAAPPATWERRCWRCLTCFAAQTGCGEP